MEMLLSPLHSLHPHQCSSHVDFSVHRHDEVEDELDELLDAAGPEFMCFVKKRVKLNLPAFSATRALMAAKRFRMCSLSCSFVVNLHLLFNANMM